MNPFGTPSNSGCRKKVDEGELSAFCHSEKVAVLAVHPPDRNLSARCTVEDPNKNGSRENAFSKALLEDPVSLCILGGTVAKIRAFCREHKAVGTISSRFRTTAILVYAVPILLMAPLLALLDPLPITSEFRVFVHTCVYAGVAALSTKIVDRLFQQTQEYLESKQKFWKAWNASNLTFDLARSANQCGYALKEVQSSMTDRLMLVVYKKEGCVQSLPEVVDTDNVDAASESDRNEEQASQLILKVWEKLKLFRYAPRDSSPPVPQANPNDDAEPLSEEVSFPIDFWTVHGILLGKQLSSRTDSEARNVCSSIFFILCYLLVLVGTSSLIIFFAFEGASVKFLVFFILFVIGMIVLGLLYRCFEAPKIHKAYSDLASNLSPLIRDRHGGCSLRYEISPISDSVCCNLFCPYGRGTWVLEDPPDETATVRIC